MDAAQNRKLDTHADWKRLKCWAHRAAISSLKSIWRPITSDQPQRLTLGLILFNIFTNDLGSGTESSLRKSAHWESGRYNRWVCCHQRCCQRQLNRSEEWNDKKFSKCTKGKCQIQHLGRNKTMPLVTLGTNHMESSLEEISQPLSFLCKDQQHLGLH